MAYRPAALVSILQQVPASGEMIMLRLPFEVTLGPPSRISSSAPTGATGANYHLCVVHNTDIEVLARKLVLSFWVCFAFSSVADSIGFVASDLGDGWRRSLLPLPCSQALALPTPTGFGAPIQTNGFTTLKPTWLLVIISPGDGTCCKMLAGAAGRYAMMVS
jgi:hypothetical protein